MNPVLSAPTAAHQATLALLHRVLVAAARRRQGELPGLVETLQNEVVLTAGGTTRPAYGWFAEGAWRYNDRYVHELFLNADRRYPHPGVGKAEDVLITLLHEGCHVWAKANGIQDTSRGGRYHNRRFAQIALSIGLIATPDPVIGHRTPSLSSWARDNYADLLSELDKGLVIAREPKPAVRAGLAAGSDGTAPGPQPSTGKYAFASCRCRDSRGRALTIRVAKGSWRPGAICCSICGVPFTESLTAQGQAES